MTEGSYVRRAAHPSVLKHTALLLSKLERGGWGWRWNLPGFQNRKLEERKHVTLSQVTVLTRRFSVTVLDTILYLQRAETDPRSREI